MDRTILDAMVKKALAFFLGKSGKGVVVQNKEDSSRYISQHHLDGEVSVFGVNSAVKKNRIWNAVSQSDLAS